MLGGCYVLLNKKVPKIYPLHTTQSPNSSTAGPLWTEWLFILPISCKSSLLLTLPPQGCFIMQARFTVSYNWAVPLRQCMERKGSSCDQLDACRKSEPFEDLICHKFLEILNALKWKSWLNDGMLKQKFFANRQSNYILLVYSLFNLYQSSLFLQPL